MMSLSNIIFFLMLLVFCWFNFFSFLVEGLIFVGLIFFLNLQSNSGSLFIVSNVVNY